MGTKHDLKEMKFAKDVVKDFPFLQIELAKTAEILYDYRKYMVAGHVLSAIEDSLVMIKRQLAHYKKVHENRGEE